MTKLRYSTKPRWRESEVVYRDARRRLICIALEPSSILLRLKGTRTIVRLPISTAFQQAAWLEGQKRIADRKQRRAAVKRGAL